MHRTSTGRYRTVARSVTLFRSFLVEQTDPERFYTDVAEDTIALISRHEDLRGRTVLDVGAGQDQFGRRFVEHGARYLAVDIERGSLNPGPESGAVVAQGERLPFPDGVADVVMSNNVMEHVVDRGALVDEMMRVVRPGGLVFISYTAWFGPWGGHETSPWHLLGGERARARYERKHGRAPKNRFGETMHAVTVAEGLGWARDRLDAELLEAAPRYHPDWADLILRVPGLREVASWNLMLVLRRR
ncbi:class I SAM-dependent methyltransferase [Knoellia subterranea]|uniref:SAM-dependent methyltransferase n=1 Tax=Knoellia subterranea KCTC 19937 TaxID=1385521 RepID=A0A0A0JPX4_9MICO|nr:class I SAM-dependent methyltransferase [Knoellia subterranea]KGN38804.1 SAM-dependent methyltransferase [Knoellia subterranea KCTC 19937]